MTLSKRLASAVRKETLITKPSLGKKRDPGNIQDLDGKSARNVIPPRLVGPQCPVIDDHVQRDYKHKPKDASNTCHVPRKFQVGRMSERGARTRGAW